MEAGVRIVGCTGVHPSRTDVLGVKIIGGDEQLPRLFAEGVREAFVAIGDNRKRRDLTRTLRTIGFQLANAISPRASVSRFARLGGGIAVMPGAVVNAGAALADGAIVNTGATVDHDCIVGPFAHIAPGTNLGGCVQVGEGALLGIGSRAIPGVSIGDWSVVGAGSVIIHNLEPKVVAAGVPASVIRPVSNP
jgi:UDP-perosamine 4-acetyltransferase